MVDGTLMLWMSFPLAGIIYSQRNEFVLGGKINGTCDWKLIDSPVAVVTMCGICDHWVIKEP